MPSVWKSVPSLPDVEVTKLGQVRVRGKNRKAHPSPEGSLSLTINTKGYNSTVRVVRLVGEAWSKKYHPSLRPVYRDGNRNNVRPSNIRWVRPTFVTGHPYTKNPKPLSH